MRGWWDLKGRGSVSLARRDCSCCWRVVISWWLEAASRQVVPDAVECRCGSERYGRVVIARAILRKGTADILAGHERDFLICMRSRDRSLALNVWIVRNGQTSLNSRSRGDNGGNQRRKRGHRRRRNEVGVTWSTSWMSLSASVQITITIARKWEGMRWDPQWIPSTTCLKRSWLESKAGIPLRILSRTKPYDYPRGQVRCALWLLLR